MDEVVSLTKTLGKRLGDSGIPVYLYEYAATSPERRNLSYLRKGEYESIPDKLKHPAWKPDFGPSVFDEKFGMMALGARKFLLAYNINLKSKDTELAKEIARQIRAIRNKNDGSYESNLFRNVKAIGWYMEAYHCTQISTNITDIEASPIIEVFNCIDELAKKNGTETQGSELIGLIPKQALHHPKMSVEEAIQYLGLDVLKPFNLQERIIEYNLKIV
jgi:glutamate formiminotransferase